MTEIETLSVPRDGPNIARLSRRTGQVLCALLALVTLAFIIVVARQMEAASSIDLSALLLAFGVGMAAQLVDGALGMAYGVTSNTLLLASGVSPAAATATVHVAKTFTGAASGLAHWRLGNIDTRIFARLLIPGIIGTLAGVYLVTRIDGTALRPWISAYLLAMGLAILARAFRPARLIRPTQRSFFPIALVGGFADSIGGGGWGPVVTTSLIGSGHEPKTTIGSVNAAEFVITLASGFSFAMLIGIQHWESVAGLVIGGLIIAPFAAGLTHRIDRRALLLGVGLLISALSLFTITRAFAA
jgi:uncharacterized protein